MFVYIILDNIFHVHYLLHRVAEPNHFNADPDPAFYFDADPDPSPSPHQSDGSGSAALVIMTR